jgi:2-amino-4-hydroxy-6-hydroxymethyldihydropteridine diphosphokinase
LICYLGLGSNLASPRQQLYRAIQECRKIPSSSVTKISTIYLSKPLGIKAQPLYYNLVIELQTSLAPQQLLKACQKIETKHHRRRKQHWGSRTLDIDLLLFANLTMHTPQLTIPHPQMLQRDFVIIPLLEIAPNITMPNGQAVNEALRPATDALRPATEALRPATCSRDPEISLNAKHNCINMHRSGSRGQAAGRRDLECQQTLVFTPKIIKKII